MERPPAVPPVLPLGDEDPNATRLRVLAFVSHAFASVTTDYRRLLDTIAETTAELVGDGCMLTLLGDDGDAMMNAASWHRDPALHADYRAWLAAIPAVSVKDGGTVSGGVIRTGTPVLVAVVDPASMVAAAQEALKPLVARLNVHSFVVVPVRANQRVIGTFSLVRSGPGRGYTADDLALLNDMADRAGLAIANARLYGELERRVAERTAELRAANAELEAFDSSVAHDLVGPLNAIVGFTSLVLETREDQLDAFARAKLGRVMQAAERMQSIITGLLDLARLTHVELRRDRLDLTAMAQACIAGLRDAHPARVVEARVAPGLVARGDPRLVEPLLANLIGNAWKFTRRRKVATIEVGSRTVGDEAVFFVRDDGAGFPSQDAGRLLHSMQRLHSTEEFEGSGVGLVTVARIVRRHGGRAWAEGELDQGATIFFTLGPGPVAGQAGGSVG
jgi:signal transduction histidine kinase